MIYSFLLPLFHVSTFFSHSLCALLSQNRKNYSDQTHLDLESLYLQGLCALSLQLQEQPFCIFFLYRCRYGLHRHFVKSSLFSHIISQRVFFCFFFVAFSQDSKSLELVDVAKAGYMQNRS